MLLLTQSSTSEVIGGPQVASAFVHCWSSLHYIYTVQTVKTLSITGSDCFITSTSRLNCFCKAAKSKSSEKHNPLKTLIQCHNPLHKLPWQSVTLIVYHHVQNSSLIWTNEWSLRLQGAICIINEVYVNLIDQSANTVVGIQLF